MNKHIACAYLLTHCIISTLCKLVSQNLCPMPERTVHHAFLLPGRRGILYGDFPTRRMRKNLPLQLYNDGIRLHSNPESRVRFHNCCPGKVVHIQNRTCGTKNGSEELSIIDLKDVTNLQGKARSRTGHKGPERQ
jgi:hypothetical protein